MTFIKRNGGEKIGIVSCSNGQKISQRENIESLEKALRAIGFHPVFSDCIYEEEAVYGGSAKKRAEALMKFYGDDEITHIFDISGGDIANGVLPHLDYDIISKNEKTLWGYSDLTTVLNAIYAKTGRTSSLYQIRNLILEDRERQIVNFRNAMQGKGTELFRFDYRFIRQRKMHGILVGGNLRCLLKLAGTEFMPDFTDKIVFLESNSGTVAKIETYLCQLQQMGVFDKAAGILLGTFTEMEEKNCIPSVETLIMKIAGEDLPVAVTKDIGHGAASKGIIIGRNYILEGENEDSLQP